jgi:sulfotransferase 6B1
VTPWEKAKLRSNVLRKGEAYAMQVPRTLARYRATEEDYLRNPPILANSFPKSGTHLLLQITRAWAPRYYGSFIASMPSVTFKERSHESHLRAIDRIVPGEALPGHLFYDEKYAQALAAKNVVHFFIYRDLPEVAVSLAHYLTHMNRWHRLHRYFAHTLKDDFSRLECAVLGTSDPALPFRVPDIISRFARYKPWLTSSSVYAVNYNDLAPPNIETIVSQMVEFYIQRTSDCRPREKLKVLAQEAIIPELSHTYRGHKANTDKKLHERAQELIAHLSVPSIA